MKSPILSLLFTLFLFNTSATANTYPNSVCIADAGTDLVLTCAAVCVDLNSSGSSSGADVVYTWAGPGITGANENDPFPEVCEAGVYTLTVEDLAEGCSETDEVIVSVDQNVPIADAGPDIELDCFQGAAVLDGSNSSPAGQITYEWFNASGVAIANQATVTVVDPDTYTLVVTNFDNGCTASDEVDVYFGSSTLDVILVGDPVIECNSGSTTTIEAVASGGVAPYIYNWNNGFNGVAQDIGFPGQYTVTVTDFNGCTAEDAITIVNDNISLDLNILQQATCGGGCDGAIDLTVTGGGPGPFNFDWSDDTMDGQEDPVTFCQNEIYTVIVYDADSICTSFLDIDQFNGPSFFIQTSQTNVSCNGDHDGTATATISSGGGAASYLWCNGQTTATATGLPAGPCSVIVTNTTGCTEEQTVSITEPSALVITITGNPVIECNTGSTTTLTATITGGTAPFTYDWNNGNGANTQSVDVEQGSYTVTVTDSNGCTEVEDITVVNDNIFVDYTVVQQATCGGCDGALDISVTGQSGPFNFDWNEDVLDGQEDPVTLCENTFYEVNVYNADSSCTALLTIDDFFAFSNIDIEVESTYATCGNNDGTATVTVNSGAPDPSFIWSNGGTDASQTDLAPGGYSVSVVNNTTGCGTHQNIIVEEDPACRVQISGYVYNDNTNEDCDPATVDGGVYNIMVTLDNGDITFTDVDGYYQFDVDPGTYEVNINLTTPQYLDLCTDAITVDLPDFGGVSENNDFFIINALIQDLNIKVVKFNARPGFEQHVIICAMNFGAEPADGTVVFVHDSISDLVNTSGPGTPVYDEPAHTVSWDFQGLPPGAVWVYHAFLYHDQDVPLGTNLDYYFALEPIIGDIDPTNNVIECSMVVTGSYDPNDKRAIPGGEDEQGYIHPLDSTINYTIRFQNTGTDTAFTVVIRDTLDTNFDINSVVALPSCRPYKLDVEEDRVLKFTFENILLPDSTTNEPESHGFVMYDVKMVSGLPMGTPIENTASIYFDYNEPIITNTTLHTLSNRRVDVTGHLQTEDGVGIEGVEVALSNDMLHLSIEADADFEFIDVPTEMDYTIAPAKNDDQRNGISSYDLVFIQKHALQVELLDSPYKILAADVNNSGSVTTADIVELRKLILYIDTELQHQDAWRFVDEDFIFPDQMNPFENTFPPDVDPSEISISNLLYDYDTANFVVMKIGDVNNSVSPLIGEAETQDEYSEELVLKVENQNLEKGKDYSLRFHTANLANLISCQFTITFDPERLTFIDFEKGTLPDLSINNLGLTHLEEGAITFSWNGSLEENTDEASLFDLKFKAKQNTSWKESIELNSSYTHKEAYRQLNEEAEQLDVILLFEKSEEEDVTVLISEELVVYPNRPNPFKKETTLSFYLPEGELVDLTVFDVNGKVLKKHQAFFEKGYNSYTLDKSFFGESGLYYYEIKTKEKSVIQKMLFTK